MSKTKVSEFDAFEEAKNYEHNVDIDTEGKITLDTILNCCGIEQLKEIMELLDENSERAELSEKEIDLDSTQISFITSVYIENIFQSLGEEEEEIVIKWIQTYLEEIEEEEE